jgi:helix-turn-helix protein
MSVQAFAREAGKKIGPMGGAFMMSPSAGAAGQTAGLDFFSYYVLGRGGVLGDVDGKTVADTFYFFNPERVAAVWDAAKANNDPHAVSAHYAEACATWGRENLADIDGLDDFSKLAERVTQSAEPTPSSGLFAGWREMPLADDAAGRVAVQCVLVLRELRGGAHVEAVKHVGLEPRVAVATNSPQMYQLFGWTDEMPDAEPHRATAEEAEKITDDLVTPAFSALDEAERDTFAKILGAVATKLGV